MKEIPERKDRQQLPDSDTLRMLFQPCVGLYPGWTVGHAEPDFVSLYSPRGLELTLPGGELDPDDWEGITEETREKVRADEIEAKVIFRCIQSVQQEIMPDEW